MRGLAYAIAVIAAVAIMIGIATVPLQPTAKDSATVVSMPVSATPEVMSDAGTLTLSVPNMHCAIACFPRVKETLENTDGVQIVELAEQKEEGLIDNRQVIVKYDAGFDITAALALLSKEGFDDADVVR